MGDLHGQPLSMPNFALVLCSSSLRSKRTEDKSVTSVPLIHKTLSFLVNPVTLPHNKLREMLPHPVMELRPSNSLDTPPPPLTPGWRHFKIILCTMVQKGRKSNTKNRRMEGKEKDKRKREALLFQRVYSRVFGIICATVRFLG